MALSLRGRLDSPNFSYQLKAVKNILDTAQAGVTFWGTRVVKVGGNESSVALDKLAKKILQAASRRDFTPLERIDGMDIVKILRQFYLDTDTQVKNSNLFTKLLCFIRELISSQKSIYIGDPSDFEYHPCEVNFCFYSREQFLEEFGCFPDAVCATNARVVFGYFFGIKEDIVRSHGVQSSPRAVNSVADRFTKKQIENWFRGHLYFVFARPTKAENFYGMPLMRRALKILDRSPMTGPATIEEFCGDNDDEGKKTLRDALTMSLDERYFPIRQR